MEQPDKTDQATEETLLGGYFLSAVFFKNPSFAARPDNTGLVGLRHMLHLETDLYKQYLTFYTDQNFFSDRTKGWIELSEWDGTYAFTGIVNRFGWRVQYERDAPLDKSGLKQIYADALATALLSADAIYFPDPAKATAGIHFRNVLERLGILERVQGRIRNYPNGAATMRAMAEAEGQPIGCTQATEIRATPGVRLVGPLPAGLDLVTVYAGAVDARAADGDAARRFLASLAGQLS